MFLQEASDRFQRSSKESLRLLENDCEDVVGKDWCKLLHPDFMAHFNKRRGYNGKSVRDLLRLLRNAVRPLPTFIFVENAIGSNNHLCVNAETPLS